MYMGLVMVDCMRRKLLGIISVDFDATGPYSAFLKYLRKNENATKQFILFVYFKKTYDSVRREVLYNILIRFGIPMKLARLI
jgi:hypothetical protein